MQIVSRRFLLYFKNSNNKTNLILNCDLRPGNCLLNACEYLNFVVNVISANAKKFVIFQFAKENNLSYLIFL